MKRNDAAVKIDVDLLKKIENFLRKEENKHLYTSKKQIMNLAIIEFLKSKNNKKV